eukprot:PhF_6_TR37878/c0_g1_i3/m.56504
MKRMNTTSSAPTSSSSSTTGTTSRASRSHKCLRIIFWYVVTVLITMGCLVVQIFVFIPRGNPIRQHFVRLTNSSVYIRPFVETIIDVEVELADAKVLSVLEMNERHEFVFDESNRNRMKTSDTVNKTRSLIHNQCRGSSANFMGVESTYTCASDGQSKPSSKLVLSFPVPIPNDVTCTVNRVLCDAVADWSMVIPVNGGETYLELTVPSLLLGSELRYLLLCNQGGGEATKNVGNHTGLIVDRGVENKKDQHHGGACFLTVLLQHRFQPCPGYAEPVRTPWDVQYQKKYHSQWGPKYLRFDPSTMIQHKCLYRNVTLRMIASKSMFLEPANNNNNNNNGGDSKRPPATEREFYGFSLAQYHFFILLMKRFGGFDLSEYHTAVIDGGHMRAENELGLLYPPTEIRHQLYESGSKQAHEMTRGWIGGGLIPIDPSDPAHITLDKGLATMVSNLVLHDPIGADMTQRLPDELNMMITKKLEMSLKAMTAYTDTRKERYYYVKGSAFFFLLAYRMEMAKPHSFCVYTKTLWALRNVGPGISPKSTCDMVQKVVGESLAKGSVKCEELFKMYYFGDELMAHDPEIVKATSSSTFNKLKVCDDEEVM